MFKDPQDKAGEPSSGIESVYATYEEHDLEITSEERDFAISLISILETTELPHFEVVHTTSTRNEWVKAKAEAVFSYIPEEVAIPEQMTKEYPVAYDDETLLKAPWVNLVHGWTKVLNYMNGIRAMQRGDQEFNPEDIASITHSLYLFTTNSDPNPPVRTDKGFLEGEFSETRLRKAGVKGVNSARHVCYQEMKYMLSVVKGKFAKE